MTNDVNQLKAIFTKKIRQQLDGIEFSNNEQRYKVYRAAINSLATINQSFNETKRQQCKTAMSLAIQSLEDEYLTLVAEAETLDSNINSHAESPETLPSMANPFLSDQKQANKIHQKNFFSPKRLVAISLAAICLVIISKELFFFTYIKKIDLIGNVLAFPVILPIEDKKQVNIQARGLGSINKQVLPSRIIYNVGEERHEKLEALDIKVNSQSLLDYLQPQTEPLVLIFDFKKNSPNPIELEVLVRGLGKSVRQKIAIPNNEKAQLFVVTNKQAAEKRAKRILIRLKAVSLENEDQKPISFSIRNLTFNKL